MLDRLITNCHARIIEGDCPKSPPFPTEQLEEAVAELDKQITVITEERKDWARRFRLNDFTAWEWMKRAERAEQKVKELEAKLANRS
jgi:hypothetical protein